MKELVERLIREKKKVATMESCTGGGVADAITSIEGASEIIGFSAVTYSNDAKIMMGVSPDVIKRYSVYSMETADEMSLNICKKAGSDYGIGITGKLNRVDVNNPYMEDNVVFISVYDKKNDLFYNSKIEATLGSRAENKKIVIGRVVEMVNSTLSMSDEFLVDHDDEGLSKK